MRQAERRAVDACAEMVCRIWAPNKGSYIASNSACEKFQALCRAVDVSAITLRQALQPNTVRYRALIIASENDHSYVGPSTSARRSCANL